MGAQGIHKFTMGVAIVFLGVAVFLTRRNVGEGTGSVLDATIDQANPLEADPFGAGGASPDAGGNPDTGG